MPTLRRDKGRLLTAGLDHINKQKLKAELENLYERMNKREFVHPDPLELLYDYNDIREREIAGLVVSCLAYGNVTQILKSSKKVLHILGSSPLSYLANLDGKKAYGDFKDFKHRFTTGDEMAQLLVGLSGTIKKYETLENLISEKLEGSNNNLIPALTGFVDEICRHSGCGFPHLLPNPINGSACKRLLLYFKWMVRHDDVDPGGWNISPSTLLIPVDRHMHKIACGLGITQKKSANLKTAIEITDYFRSISPDDPTKYDFVLTRFGIRKEFDRDEEVKAICEKCLD
ncbi:MAG TPA: TIGR02757 family protein [Caldisericia bacterium]|nr:TIGR02757 family protein [Caldisericia bacterium]HPF49685.1 TIGR02757 family protein [Caldisericia bacterium]HPI84542.1 TIGR02757 family protein [Caldisericia bacterium]HPQ93657.1 TIGR02757 family protein [Caldisericia bacterium]HRV74779.1 TIGR02757 family protein [Caldisericia bacterium]